MMCGRVSDMSAGWMLPTSSGSNCSLAVSRSAESAGSRDGSAASPSTTSVKLTIAVGNSETATSPRMVGLQPGHGADFRDDRAAHRLGRDQRRGGHQRADAGREDGRNDEA